jgi:hypothetical protein
MASADSTFIVTMDRRIDYLLRIHASTVSFHMRVSKFTETILTTI